MEGQGLWTILPPRVLVLLWGPSCLGLILMHLPETEVIQMASCKCGCRTVTRLDLGLHFGLVHELLWCHKIIFHQNMTASLYRESVHLCFLHVLFLFFVFFFLKIVFSCRPVVRRSLCVCVCASCVPDTRADELQAAGLASDQNLLQNL